jgi:hypothetical protein
MLHISPFITSYVVKTIRICNPANVANLGKIAIKKQFHIGRSFIPSFRSFYDFINIEPAFTKMVNTKNRQEMINSAEIL